jgi:hypothetical protein
LAINASGVVVGCRTVNGNQTLAWVYANGIRSELPAPAGASSCAFAVNSNGTIAGTVNGEITIWQDGAARGLGLDGEVTGIDDSGVVVGAADGRAIMWANGIVTDLGPGRAVGINNRGQVATVSGDKLFMYENGTLRDLGAAANTVVNAYGLNDRGEIVGMATFGHGPEPFIYDGTVHSIVGAYGDSGAVALNNVGQILVSGEGTYGSLTEAGQSATLDQLSATSANPGHHMEGKAINDRGWIVGQSSGDLHAFLMVPKETTVPAAGANPMARALQRTTPLIRARVAP